MGKYLGLPPLPPDFSAQYAPIAVVEEEKCIGCERCPKICFFDAIFMEGEVAVIVADNCTGCGLCFEACPVDCIRWIPDKEIAGEPHPSVEIPKADLGD
jgi:Na+-translocating ferredoxin:NAD+ oxidoreductase RNF subunit RnfB